MTFLTTPRIRRALEVDAVRESVRPCPKPVRRKKTKKPHSPTRKDVLKDLEAICREIVFWRDGGLCVEREIDGGRCDAVIQWGHYIPRQQSSYLKYSLSNTFCQCGSHNNLHYHGARTFDAWYAMKFGAEGQKAIDEAARLNVGRKTYVFEYKDLLAHYIGLYDNRPSVYDFADLVKLGFYGDVLRAVFVEPEVLITSCDVERELA